LQLLLNRTALTLGESDRLLMRHHQLRWKQEAGKWTFARPGTWARILRDGTARHGEE